MCTYKLQAFSLQRAYNKTINTDASLYFVCLNLNQLFKKNRHLCLVLYFFDEGIHVLLRTVWLLCDQRFMFLHAEHIRALKSNAHCSDSF